DKNFDSIDHDFIADMKISDRDLLLLHISFERTLIKYTNWEIDTTKDICKGLFKEEINGLSTDETAATTIRVDDLQGSRCFVKLMSSNVFLLVFVPSLMTLLNEMIQKKGKYVEDKPCYLSLFIFLCERQKPLYGEPKEGPNSFQEGLLDLELSNPLGSSLKPRLIGGSVNKGTCNQADQQDQEVQENKFDRAIQIVSNLYARGFVKSIYSSILQKRKVKVEDFRMAIDACEQINLNIDITGYVNVHVLGGAEKEDANDVYQKFAAVLGHFFEPANFDGDGLEDTYYYYRIKKLSTDVIDNTDIFGNFLETFNCSENPLFIRLECIFRKPLSEHADSDPNPKEFKVAGYEVVRFPVASLPITYHCESEGRSYDFTPKSIGTDASPVESSDGTTATLRIICLALPRVEDIGEEDYGLERLFEKSDDDLFDKSDDRINSSLNLLTTDKREALIESIDRIDWLLKEEIMHELLKTQNVNRSVLAFIQKQLKKKGNPFVDFPTTFTVPLSFVRQDKGPVRFLQEFSKADMRPYSLNQVEDCFYISLDDEIPESLEVATLNADDSLGSTESQQVLVMETSNDEGADQNVNNGYASGLGISLTSRENMGDSGGAEMSPKKNIRHKQLFWLLLIPQETSIQVYFYSKAITAMERSRIMRHVRNCIVKISERVNRLILLEELNEKRLCSKYLVPPDDSTDYDPTSEEDDMQSNEGQLTKKFKVGQFSCPIIYRRALPLHFRVSPNAVLSIANDKLGPLSILNRKNMFVYSVDKNIVYIKLSEVETNETIENITEASPLINADAGNNGLAAPFVPRVAPRSRTVGRELVVDVFGLNVPGKESEEILKGLISSLETKVIPTATLPIMSSFLARNRNAALTKEDVEYILPIHRTPKNLWLGIPTSIKNIYAFLVYFNQNISGQISGYLKSLSGEEVAAVIKRHHESLYGIVGSDIDRSVDNERAPYDIRLREFSFYYNFSTRTPIELSVGEGIAGICLTLIDSDGRPVYELPSEQIYMGDNDMSDILKYISKEETILYDVNNKYDYRLFVELWTESTLNLDKLFEYMKKSFRQCLCDYFIEVAITQGLDREPENFVDNGTLDVDRDRSEDNQRRETSVDDYEELSAKGHEEEHPVDEYKEGIPVDDHDGTDIKETSAVEYIDPRVQEAFIKPSLELIGRAVDLENPTLVKLTVQLDMPSWMMDDFLNEVREVLSSVHHIFTPIILRTKPNASMVGEENVMYEIYRPKNSTLMKEKMKMDPHQYLIIAGLKELNQRYGLSEKIDDTQLESLMGTTDGAHSRKSSYASASQRHLLEEIMTHTITPSSDNRDNTKTFKLFRSCFLFMTIDGFGLSIYIYNWQKHSSDYVFTAMTKISDWQNKRIKLLNNVLHQKMGLFYHTNGFSFKAQPGLNAAKAAAPVTDWSLVNSLINDRFPPRPKLDERVDGTKKNPAPNNVESNENKKNQVSHNIELDVNQVLLTSMDLNEVLKETYIELFSENEQSSEGIDALKRHGMSFIEEWDRQNKVSLAHDNARNVYKKWKKRIEDNGEGSEKISRSDFEIIFRTSRLLHCDRAKVIFNEDVSDLYNDMISAFSNEYLTYLEDTGMQKLYGVDDGDSESVKSDKASDKFPTTFLLKALRGGTIICEVQIQKEIVFVTLHMLNRRYGKIRVVIPGSSSVGYDRESMRTFTEECGVIKKKIRVNNFIYDFHLRYIKQQLEKSTKNPLKFNIIEILRSISHNSNYVRHRVYHYIFSEESDLIPDGLFDYIVAHPHYFGLYPIIFGDKPIACFAKSVCGNSCSSELCDFRADKRFESTLSKEELIPCIMVLSLPPNTECVAGKIYIEYHVIAFHDNDGYSKSREDYQGKLKIRCCQKLESITRQAITYHRRDKLWDQLYTLNRNRTSHHINVEELKELIELCQTRELDTINSNFCHILTLSLNWTELLNFLLAYYSKESRELYVEQTRHLMILSPHDLFIHFILPPTVGSSGSERDGINKLMVNVICREVGQQNHEKVLDQFVADIKVTISHWLWRKLINA
ncbi:5175_t:CDS:2, partial [Acaulospora morrowiae]